MRIYCIKREKTRPIKVLIGIAMFFIVLYVLLQFPGHSFGAGSRPPDSMLVEITDFGTNPGGLKMYAYTPDNVPDNAPLVVALHGCTQNAAEYASRTEWNKLADQVQFYLVYPEQQQSNNFQRCFNWFSLEDIARDQGEASSIKQMIDKMQSDHSIDSNRVYITGLSAGGYMTTVLLATYPEIFAGGAVMAGGPYRCATSISEAISACMPGNVNKTPEQWGRLVRDAFPHSHTYPILSIFHGSQDSTVDDKNMIELMEQWTHVHQADQTAETDELFRGHDHKIYQDTDGKAVVETYHLKTMGHAITVDPGNKEDQGGTLGPFSEDKDIYSSFYAAEFWGLTP